MMLKSLVRDLEWETVERVLILPPTECPPANHLTAPITLAGCYSPPCLERLIEENKERYYEVLEQSSQRWHDGKHDPWPAMNFLLFILTQACKEFEERMGKVKSPRGEKTALVEAAIERQAGEFSVSDLQNACPGVGVDLIRQVLKRLKGSRIACLGRGQAAKWKKLGK